MDSSRRAWLTSVIITALMTVCLGQVNQLPKFNRNMNNHTIREDHIVGTFVYGLKGVDYEEKPLTYGIISQYFEVRNPRNGSVFLKAPLDFESRRVLYPTVTLRDDVQQIQEQVTVYVMDVNDEYPIFADPSYITTVREDIALGTVIFKNIKFTDVDTVNDLLTISCEDDTGTFGPGSCAMFGIDVIQRGVNIWVGRLTLRQALSYRTRSSYRFTLLAYDGVHTTRQSCIVNVTPAGPTFDTDSLIGYVYENSAIGLSVLTLLARGGGAGEARLISYRLLDNPGGAFQLNENTGVVSTAIMIDREASQFSLGYVRLLVEAISTNLAGEDRLTAQAYVTIYIRDVNEFGPEITPNRFTVTLKEDVADGSTLQGVSMQISDRDWGENGQFDIFLRDYGNIFEVLPTQGNRSVTASITVKNGALIDYDIRRQYFLTVVARERSTQERYSATANITVNIEKVIDDLPYFLRDSYSADVEEMAPGGTSVITITAVDPGSSTGSTLEYSLVGNGANLFFVNRYNGRVTVAACATPGKGNCLDYEQKTRYILTFIARDSRDPSRRADVPLIINILDNNDEVPTFDSKLYIGYIEEGAMIPDPQLKVTAFDRDSGRGGNQITYRIIAGNQNGLFQIGLRSGIITATRPVDYEQTPRRQGYYLLGVEATDGKFASTANVRINVIDLNDNSPIFNPNYYTPTVSELATQGTLVERVFATDQDEGAAGEIVYSIVGGGNGKFTINPRTGEIRIAPGAKLDYSQTRSYRLIVSASDRGDPPRSATATVAIGVLPATSKCPYFNPSTLRVNILENATVETVIARVTAVDPNLNAQLLYSIIPPVRAWDLDGKEIPTSTLNLMDYFIIEETTGAILIKKVLPSNTLSRIQLTIRASYQGRVGPSNCENGTVEITVQDLNDKPPYFIPPWREDFPHYAVDANEEQPFGTYVTTMVAVDPDGFINEYRIFYNPGGHFKINSVTGVVNIIKPLDYEEFQTTQVVVLAIDNGNPPKTATATVGVRVVNINDINPVFSRPFYTANVQEHSKRGTSVTTVTASDGDYDDFGKVLYTLENEKRFSINNVTGLISVENSTALDREQTPIISITAIAYDSPNHPTVRRFTSAPVYITLTDINDNAPRFTLREYIKVMVQTQAVGSFVLQLSATDADTGNNAKLTYSKVSGDINGLFYVNPDNGTVTTRRSLKEFNGTFNFTVMVKDGGFLTDKALVSIRILSENNGAPQWITPKTNNETRKVEEEKTIGIRVTQVSAIDPDVGPGGRISYFFYYNNTLTDRTQDFKINTITGVISTVRQLDRETRDTYTLHLVARDHGSPPMESSTYLTIQVTDVDDNNPEFPKYRNCCTIPYEFQVLENSPNSTFIGKVTANDKDLQSNDTVRYEIESVDEEKESHAFYIDPVTGEIRTNRTLDHEKRAVWTLTVKATNLGFLHPTKNDPKCKCNTPHRVKVIIKVIDVNDNTPIFSRQNYSACVSMHAQFDDPITQVRAQDKDSANFNRIKYTLESGEGLSTEGEKAIKEAHKLFRMGVLDGTLYSNTLMMYYRKYYFELKIKATDNQGKSGTAQLNVHVVEPSQSVTITLKKPMKEAKEQADDIVQWVQKVTGGGVVCVNFIGYVVRTDKVRSERTDLHIHVIDPKTNKPIPAWRLVWLLWGNELTGEKKKQNDFTLYKVYRVHDIKVTYEAWMGFRFLPLLIAVILILLLIFIAFLLLCCLCFCLQYCSKRSRYAGGATTLIMPTEKMARQYENQELKMNVPNHYLYDNDAFEGHDAVKATIAGAVVSSSETDGAAGTHFLVNGHAVQDSQMETRRDFSRSWDTHSGAGAGMGDGQYRIEAELDNVHTFGRTQQNMGQIRSRDDMYLTQGYAHTRPTNIGAKLSASSHNINYSGTMRSTRSMPLNYNFDVPSFELTQGQTTRHAQTYEDRWDGMSHRSSPVISPSFSTFDYRRNEAPINVGSIDLRGQSMHRSVNGFGTLSSSYGQQGNFGTLSSSFEQPRVSATPSIISSPPVLKVEGEEVIPVPERGVFQGDVLVRSRPSSRASQPEQQVAMLQPVPIVPAPVPAPQTTQGSSAFVPLQGGTTHQQSVHTEKREFHERRQEYSY